MAAHTATGPRHRSASLDFGDPAFQPQAGFDFEDMVPESLSGHPERVGMSNYCLSMHDGSGIEFSGTRDGHSPTERDLNHQGAFVQPAPVNVWNQPDNYQSPYLFAFQTNGAYLFGSEQNGITQQRNNVAQHFGQIIPPDDSTQSKTSTSIRKTLMSDDVALKTKREDVLRKDSGQDVAGNDEGNAEDEREKYRERNRLAAAKCRAKQKQGNEGLSERCSQLNACNEFLKQEERALRDDLSKLRLKALSHNSNACHCHDVHRYNAYKAREAATGFGWPISSPHPHNVSSPLGLRQFRQPEQLRASGPAVDGEQHNESQPLSIRPPANARGKTSILRPT
ncbi:hypothetical protein KC361_g1544 [Hortaea werneckii]|nr:hypothetical protein KC361_g1544 [Hortaea werneckii]